MASQIDDRYRRRLVQLASSKIRPVLAGKIGPDDVAHVDPHLLPHLASDVAQPLDAVETHGLETSVSQHLGYLGVLLSILAEDELSLEALVLILSTAAILASLSLVFRDYQTRPVFF